MADAPPISDRVRELAQKLASVEAIEALLVLVEQRSRTFTARDLGRELYLPRSIEPTLERLASLNLLDVHVREDVRYRYSPSSEELAEVVSELLVEYRRRRLAVLDSLVSTSPVRAFADAFRIRRRKKSDG